MTSAFNRILFSTFVIFISILARFTTAQAVSEAATTLQTRPSSVITTTLAATTATSTTSTVSSVTTSSSTSNTSTDTTEQSVGSTRTTTPVTDANSISTTSRSYTPRSGPGLWLLAALLVTIVIVIIAGILFYRHQSSPYRRFLHNWRSREDDTDNIILQLEQTDSSRNPWPPRISFT